MRGLKRDLTICVELTNISRLALKIVVIGRQSCKSKEVLALLIKGMNFSLTQRRKDALRFEF